MSIDRPIPLERFLPLRPVEFSIMLSLAGGERHGYAIIQEAERRGGSPAPDVGTLYRALRRMQDQGLIRESARRDASDAGMERRNYYALTTDGLKVARLEARRLEALTRAAMLGGLLEVGQT